MSFKFAAVQRIRQEEEFRYLLKKARKIRTDFFLYFLGNAFPYHRFAISVNKKISNAVQRNYIKRRMKELFRLNQHLVSSKYDFWIVMKKKFDKGHIAEIERLLIDAFVKIEYQ